MVNFVKCRDPKCPAIYSHGPRPHCHVVRVGAPDAMRVALEFIAKDGCRTFTTGIGSCFKNGRFAGAYYGAERCCDACLADAAIKIATRAEPLESLTDAATVAGLQALLTSEVGH